MANLNCLSEFEAIINRGSMPAFILGVPIYKGAVGRQNQYKFVVNSDDHLPPHVHISLHDKQIAKYDLLTGARIESELPKLDKIFKDWFSIDTNKQRAKDEWERFHGTITS